MQNSENSFIGELNNIIKLSYAARHSCRFSTKTFTINVIIIELFLSKFPNIYIVHFQLSSYVSHCKAQK